MRNTNTGGPAFPVAEYVQHNGLTIGQQEGMTLRDYFAAKAMQALISANGPMPTGSWPTHAERTAYWIADAMLKAREA